MGAGETVTCTFFDHDFPDADLRIIKSDTPDPVVVGQPLVYHLAVDNLGENTAPGVSVVDDLSADVTFVSATPSQGSCARWSARHLCAWHDRARIGAVIDVTARATVGCTVLGTPLGLRAAHQRNVSG